MYIVIDRDNNREFAFMNRMTAQEQLVYLCSCGICAYIIIERDFNTHVKM